MDNLSSHKVAGVEVVCLPTYSADLNPIENVFAKLKLLVGKLRL